MGAIKIKAAFFLVFISSMATYSFAQPGTDLPAEQVEVIKIFEAQLAESEKVAVNPELPPTDTSIQRQQYDVPAKSIEVEYQAPRIRPIAHKSDEDIPDAYKTYLKLGGGLPKSIYGEGAFNTLFKLQDKSTVDIGLDLLHHSGDYSTGDIENRRFSLTKAEGKGTYYSTQGYAVGANMGFTSDKVHYYGYSTDVQNPDEYPNGTFEPEAVRQVFSTFDLGAKIFNGVQTAGDINYSAGVDLYVLSDRQASDETGLDFKLKGTKWFKEKHSLDIGLRTDFTWYNDTMNLSQTLHNYTLSPSFTFHASAIKVKVGARVVSSNDEFFLFPDAEVVANITGNELAFYVGVEGDLQKNNFRAISNYNPFIHSRFPAPDNNLRNTKYFNVYAGFRGNLKFFEYTLQAGYKPTNDLALYKFDYDYRDAKGIYAFNVVYDNADIFNIGGSVKAVPLRGLAVTATLSQNIFNLQREDKPWHLPSFEANFQVLYTFLQNKVNLKAQLYLENGVPANPRQIGRAAIDLGSLYDLNIGGEYWFVKNIGAFVNINNILNNHRPRWLYYPTVGANFLAGFTARF
ncbi:MAG: hypothetical protein H6577_21605 [Lewinellaceae bacterium]|nr:hypothetical protein [Saprospiraceae bacterium]MCB9340729.1 hypothetical protein [Lewinellaceae bacterium]